MNGYGEHADIRMQQNSDHDDLGKAIRRIEALEKLVKKLEEQVNLLISFSPEARGTAIDDNWRANANQGLGGAQPTPATAADSKGAGDESQHS